MSMRYNIISSYTMQHSSENITHLRLNCYSNTLLNHVCILNNCLF